MEIYLSQLLDTAVKNKSSEKIGTLSDLVTTNINRSRPFIDGFIVKRHFSRKKVYIPNHHLSMVSTENITLNTDVVDLKTFIQKENEVLLVGDVYDKQIVDIDGRHLTRVNDLVLEVDNNMILLKGVDVSLFGVMRRLKIPNLGIIKPNVIDWEDAQFLGSQLPVKFNIKYSKLEELHPMDIIRILLQGPGYRYGSKILTSLRDSVAADVLEELSPILQKDLINTMKTQDIVDVINHMRTDKAADLFLMLGSDFTHKILPLLDKNHAGKIRKLLSYLPDSTGAFMTTEYLAVPAKITIEELVNRLQNKKNFPDFDYYIFVLENEFSNKLAGVLSSTDYLKVNFATPIDEIMTKNLIKANPKDNIKESLKKMYLYNLSALPVVNNSDELLGIVTFRDAVSTYLPQKWKSELS